MIHSYGVILMKTRDEVIMIAGPFDTVEEALISQCGQPYAFIVGFMEDSTTSLLYRWYQPNQQWRLTKEGKERGLPDDLIPF